VSGIAPVVTETGAGGVAALPGFPGVDPHALLRALRPQFRRDPSAGVRAAALPVLSTSGADVSLTGSVAARLRAGALLGVGLNVPAALGGEPSAGLSVRGRVMSGPAGLVALPPGCRAVVLRTHGKVPRAYLVDLAGSAAEDWADADGGSHPPADGTAFGHAPVRIIDRATSGLRGVRFARLDLDEAPVLADWKIDAAADAAARTVIAGLWVAAVDTALQSAVRYTRSRHLYGATVWDIPHARGLIAEAHTDLLIADAIVHTSLSAGSDPEHPTASALPLVPKLLNDAMRSLSVLFGSTFYARVEPYALFETLVRDVASMRLLEVAARYPGADTDLVDATLVETMTDAASRVGGADLAALIARHDTRGADGGPVWHAMAAAVELGKLGTGGRGPAPGQEWLEAALTRLEARLSRRRVALSETAIEAAALDADACVRAERAITFDRVPLSEVPSIDAIEAKGGRP
jgi:hypothetical protein